MTSCSVAECGQMTPLYRCADWHSRFLGMISDTTPDAVALVQRAIHQQSPAQRVDAAIALSESVRAISLATLRARFPECSTLELVALITGESMVPAARSGPRPSP